MRPAQAQPPANVWARQRRDCRPYSFADHSWSTRRQRASPGDALHIARAPDRRARRPLAKRSADGRRGWSSRRRRASARRVGGCTSRARNAIVELSSSAFANGGAVPRRHSCEGEDLSPPLEWAGVPGDAVSLALIVDDPDAPVGTFTHWLGWGMDPGGRGLGEDERAPWEGRNDFREVGYRGPCPPRGDGPHGYLFRLYALGSEPVVPAGAGRRELERALRENVLAVAELLGTYER